MGPLLAERVKRIGFLMGTSENGEGKSRIKAFEQGLQNLGWHNGRNLQIEYRWASGDPNRIAGYAAELVGLAPDMIVASNTPVVNALIRKTQTIPIVFVMVSDPVGSGLVETLARPGRNVTGYTTFEYTMATKWLELLKEVAPGITRVGLMVNPETNPGNGALYSRSIEAAARSMGVKPILQQVHILSDIDKVVSEIATEPGAGVIVIPDAFTTSHADEIITALTRHSLPSLFAYRIFAVRGGLISYGINTGDHYRQSADYVDRILKGGNPAELPIQAPVKFELVINLKTAKALGLTVPLIMQMTANEAIE